MPPGVPTSAARPDPKARRPPQFGAGCERGAPRPAPTAGSGPCQSNPNMAQHGAAVRLPAGCAPRQGTQGPRPPDPALLAPRWPLAGRHHLPETFLQDNFPDIHVAPNTPASTQKTLCSAHAPRGNGAPLDPKLPTHDAQRRSRLCNASMSGRGGSHGRASSQCPGR